MLDKVIDIVVFRCSTTQRLALSQYPSFFPEAFVQVFNAGKSEVASPFNFIVQQMCVSYSTLHRRIKSLTGMTVNEYVRKHRLVKAMQLLHEGHNATEVAMRCGFRSPSYFTRCFKAEYGILPSEV